MRSGNRLALPSSCESESTTHPGTTGDRLVPTVARAGPAPGRDVAAWSSPVRVAPSTSRGTASLSPAHARGGHGWHGLPTPPSVVSP